MVYVCIILHAKFLQSLLNCEKRKNSPDPGKLPTIWNVVARNAPGSCLYCNHQPNLVDQMNCKNFNTTKLFNKNAKISQPVEYCNNMKLYLPVFYFLIYSLEWDEIHWRDIGDDGVIALADPRVFKNFKKLK